MQTLAPYFSSNLPPKNLTFLSIDSKEAMHHYVVEAWALLKAAYAEVAGGLLFKSPEDLIQQSHTWNLAFKGQNLVAVTVHKFKQGLKLVALATQRAAQEAKQALIHLVSQALETGWMEVSEAFEAFVMKYCQGYRYLLNADIAYQLLQKPELVKSDNQYHYQRLINGMKKTKLALGTLTS